MTKFYKIRKKILTGYEFCDIIIKEYQVRSKNMALFAVSTDSTSDLKKEYVQKRDIWFVPLTFTLEKDGDGKGYFVLPETDAEILAIGFIVLMEIDKKHTDLLTFVNEWFSVLDNNQRSFNFFAESFLIPFQSTTQKVAYMLINEQNYQDEVIEEGRKDALAKQDETSDSGEKSLYQTIVLAPATRAMMKSTRTPYLSQFFAGDHVKRTLCFLPVFPCIHETISCMIPSGHIDEQ